jgi:hypothetical protein
MGSGDPVGGDAMGEAGVAAVPPGNRTGTSCGGRFWILGEDTSDDEDQGSPCSDPTRALRYVSNLVSSNGISSSARRLKRDHKRLMQRRWAAMKLAVSPSSRCDLPPSPGMIGHNLQRRKTLVLEPSTFLLESFNANEWITVLRHRQRSKCRPLARRGSAMVLPVMESRLGLRRSINCPDLASVSGQKAHDRMLLCPSDGVHRRSSVLGKFRQ